MESNHRQKKGKTNIKAGVNRIKTKQGRLRNLKVLQKSLLFLLEKGFNPYANNSELIKELNGTPDNGLLDAEKGVKVEATERNITKQSPEIAIKETVQENNCNINTIESSFAIALKIKQQLMNTSSYVKYKSRMNRFQKWLVNNHCNLNVDIAMITKKMIIDYLNEVLQSSSARNRNNTRTDLASLFQVLEDNELIRENFVRKINVLRAIPVRNKSYTPIMQETLFEYLQLNQPTLQLFVKFISYNFLRPIEVCRLRIQDVDLVDKKLYVRAKNSPVKIKIIPDILLKEIPDVSHLAMDDYLFAKNAIGGQWDVSEESKRDYYTKSFKKVKKHFNLGSDYGLYSFRHTFITKLYQEMIKNDKTPFEVKSKLMLITGHSSMKALEQYLRSIDAQLPEDYSHLLQ